MATELGGLARDLATAAPEREARDYCYDAGKCVRWRPRDAAGPPYEVHDGLGNVVQDLASREPKFDFPTYCFRDAVPRLSKIATGDCARPIPDVRVQTGTGTDVTFAGVPQGNPPGLDVVTVLTAVGEDALGNDATEWCAIWMVPAGLPAGKYRFHIDRIAGAALTSTVFPVGGLSPVFFEHPPAPLEPDRAAGAFCNLLAFLGLCPEPQTCQAVP